MKIHEYQAKAILAKFGVPVPRGEVVFKKEEARAAAQRIGTSVVVVKAQIHAGGRGKAGGVKLAKSPDEAASLAANMLGKKLVTPQTGPEGRVVRRLLIEEGFEKARKRGAWKVVSLGYAGRLLAAYPAPGTLGRAVHTFGRAVSRSRSGHFRILFGEMLVHARKPPSPESRPASIVRDGRG